MPQIEKNCPIIKTKTYINMKNVWILLCTFLWVACTPSNTDNAFELLNQARSAMHQNRYNDAHTLIDSLRHTYPKEVDCRKAALAFYDSLELHEAKFAFAKADSALTFKRLELEDRKKQFVLEKDGRFQSVGNYVVPAHAGSKTHLKFFAEVAEDGTMQIVSIDNKRKYHFTRVAVGDARGSSAILPPNATAKDALAVEQCYQLARLFADVKAGQQEVEKQMLKVRFYEQKLEKGE